MGRSCGQFRLSATDPVYMSRKFESFERINSIRETNGNFDSRNSCKRLGISRLHELHESKFPFVSRIEFIRSKLSNFSAHVYGATVRGWVAGVRARSRHTSEERYFPALGERSIADSATVGRRPRRPTECVSPHRPP